MISKESIDRVKSQASIVQIISETVNLKRSGSNYSGLCPFHTEKTPSFHVREHTNSFHCFGCGKSGNVITYVMERSALSFPEAVEFLADKFGITLTYEKTAKNRGPRLDKEELYRVTQAAQGFFSQALLQNAREPKGEFAHVVEYVKKRGLGRDQVRGFGIGYAIGGRDALVQALVRAGFKEELIVQVGLAKRNAQGTLYDMFRGRLTFPIFLDNRRIVGFGGRIIPGVVSEEEAARLPKYLNSPESPIYYKSKTLFGLPQAMDAIRKSGEVYLVEGYMDVIGLASVGVQNVVASCGTATTESHFRRLSSLAGKIHLLFDGDTAGIAAAAKAFPVSRNVESDVDVVFLPDSQDPDDFARLHGQETVGALKNLRTVLPVEAFCDALIERLGCSPESPPGPNLLGRIAAEVGEVIGGVESEVSRTALAGRVARRLGIDVDDMRRIVEGKGANAPQPQAAVAEVDTEDDGEVLGSTTAVPDLPHLDRQLLRASVVLRDELVTTILRNPTLCELLHVDTMRFLQGLATILGETESMTEEQKDSIRAHLRSFGPSWVSLWKEAHTMVSKGRIDMKSVFSEALESAERRMIELEIEELDASKPPSGANEGDLQIHLQNKLSLQRRLKGMPTQE